MPELTAYHEVGHALMALLLGGKVRLATIKPDNDDERKAGGLRSEGSVVIA
jgi:ATP-dependent Zn protease